MTPPETRSGKVASNHHTPIRTGIGPADHPVNHILGILRGTTRRTQPAKSEFIAQVFQRQG